MVHSLLKVSLADPINSVTNELRKHTVRQLGKVMNDMLVFKMCNTTRTHEKHFQQLYSSKDFSSIVTVVSNLVQLMQYYSVQVPTNSRASLSV